MSNTQYSNWAFRLMSIIHDNPLRRRFDNPFKTLKSAGLKPGQTALEIGCGPGFFTIPAAKIVTETGYIYSLDIHPLAIQKVQEKMEREGITNIGLFLRNAVDTQLSEASIDLVFLFGLPRLFRNKELFQRILDELYRVLKVDGVVAIKSTKQSLINQVEKKKFNYTKTTDGILIFTKNKDLNKD
jgi:ubiquinone/menaquinone biosynthesis C-methylase UbiE